MKIYLLATAVFILAATLSAYADASAGKTGNTAVTDTLQSSKASTYNKISAGSKIQKGLFTVFQKEGSYFFEIPDSLLKRDMLMASRVVNISDNSKISAGQRRANPVLISFSKRDNLLLLQRPAINAVADPDDPISVSLANNKVVPVAVTFDIIARNASDDASVIDVTKFFSAEVELVFPAGIGNTGRLDPKASHIVGIMTYPQNVEVKSFYNYTGGKEPFAVTVNYSCVLLGKEPYRVRYADKRIGFSSENRRIFTSGKPVSAVEIINRWRVEPRNQDLEKFKRGELVVPQKQIVFYVDTVMPLKWRGYVRKGIECWNLAFEKIGFKDVIKAIDYPQDSNFDPDDIRHNCFRYVTSADANAQGLQWIDPRSGEIVQGDIIWWHNVIDLLQTWRFVQTAAADPEARAKEPCDEIMGNAIAYAVAHEMGHVLGLQHNMRGSFAVPTDSLRSATFTQKYGTTASIMDYSRNNYVAQPGDKEKGVVLTPPLIGLQDYFSIKWGYQPELEAATPEEELPALNKWFFDNKHDPIYIFSGTAVSPVVPDPSSQGDALGNDLIRSAQYGIANIKLTAKNLVKWTLSDGDNYDLLKKRREALTKLYFRITNLTLSYLGGVYEYNGNYGQFPADYVPVEASRQKETIRFIMQELTHTEWLDDIELVKLLGPDTGEIPKWQSGMIDNLLGNFILPRLINNQSLYLSEPYTIREYLTDLDTNIWKATTAGSYSDKDRYLQLAYIDRLCALVQPMLTANPKNETPPPIETMISSAAAAQLPATRARVLRLINANAQHSGHYKQIIRMIDNCLK